ncbi:type III polyketide synthase [Uniformispora flossi]|uniref:type III polyketide synthase n=1 Tax=Uniformispora flossi TaxID=3390723 RepID=UPI003C2DD748
MLAIHTVLPQHRYPQDTLTDLIADMCLPAGADQRALRRLHASSTVQARHLALPIEQYARLDDFGRSNDAWIGAAVELGEEAVAGALAQAGLRPDDVDLVACVSVTGLAVPSVDARLALRMGMRQDVKRLPLFGLGCVAGAAGLARVHDFLRGHPTGVAVLLAVELCSLTLQRGDGSAANLVAGALFGDGAGAVVAVGSAHPKAQPEAQPKAQPTPDRPGSRTPAGTATPTTTPATPHKRSRRTHGPRIIATRSTLYPETEHVLGWEVGASGFRVVLTADVPDLVRAHLRHEVCAFLGEHGLVLGDIATWVCHPGGPKVVEAVGESLGLAESALEPTWRSLAAVGNLSSASVLHILQSVEESARPAPGSWGIMLALGPGFCSELVLLRW